MLHLQCGTGEASAELAEQGAVVTAVDPSEQLLDEARERWPKILWIQADAAALPAELRRGRFDLVYSPEGVIANLADLDAWARGHRGGAPARAASCSCTTTIPSRSASTACSTGATTTSRRASGGSAGS